MSNPFPGVNPFLESQHLWRDFHLNFLASLQHQLLDRLPDGYDVRVEVDVFLVYDNEIGYEVVERKLSPDVTVEHSQSYASAGEPDELESGDVETATLTLPPPVEVELRHLRIIRRPERRLVSIIEFLSPTNKESGREAYLQKRGNILDTSAHLVELDLLVRGRKLPMCERLPRGLFHFFVSRADERPKSAVAGWGLQQHLPQIPIPLAGPDECVVSDLQAVFDTAWGRGRYEKAVDYTKPLDLPLSDDDQQWVAERLAANKT